MRPLSSPVRDHRLLGRVEAAIGMVFIIVAAALSAFDAIVGFFLMTPLMASVLYFLTFRPAARRAVRDPATAPTSEREQPGAYLQRLRWPLAAQVVVFLGLTATARAPGLLGGIALGIGVALLLTARWLERWENANDVGLLREPGPRGRSGGGGGYYVARERKTGAPRITNDA